MAKKRAQGPFPFPDFNPTRPDVSKLPAIAEFEAATVDIYKTWLHDMTALGDPAQAVQAWHALLEALRRHVDVITEQQSAAARGDAAVFTKDYYEGNNAQADMATAATKAGVQLCADAAAA